MLWGHRRDPRGFADALIYIDQKLPEIQALMGEDDLLILTADHGCDPSYTATTDHTREYVPLLVYGKDLRTGNLGTRACFADLAATVAGLLGIDFPCDGQSFAPRLLKKET